MLLFAVAIFDPTWLAVLPTVTRIEHHAWRGAMRGNAWTRGKLLQVGLFSKKVGESPVRCGVCLLADLLIPTGLPPLKLCARLVAK
jgi:hypothetical protein